MTETSTWSRGYPVSESYPPSWHSFQSPTHLRAICALMGVAWEVDADTPLSIAEVGCGTGYTAHMLAAGNPQAQVLGLDYNPAHIAEARSMCSAAGLTNLSFVEADLAALDGAALDALPEFDLVTVHGVWSWVGDAVREGLLRLLQRRLKPGGLALVSYNALPGASGTQGLQRLVQGMLQRAGKPSDGLAQASELVKRLLAAEAQYLPESGWRRMITGEQPARPAYLLHEFQTEHWRPSFHADVAAALGRARCDYVGSATMDENFAQMSLSPQQREVWEGAPDAVTRELIFDLCVPRAFRRDLYVRGLRRVPREPAVDALWLAAANLTRGQPVLRTQAGEAALPQGLVEAVRAALTEGPQTIGNLRRLPGCAQVTGDELLALLVGSGCAVPLWCPPGSGAAWDQAVAAARRMNIVSAERLAPHGIGSGLFGLATPLLGGALRAEALELAVVRLLCDPAVAAACAADTPQAEAQALVKRLLPPSTPPADALKQLHEMVTDMLLQRRPVWQALQIL